MVKLDKERKTLIIEGDEKQIAAVVNACELALEKNLYECGSKEREILGHVVVIANVVRRLG